MKKKVSSDLTLLFTIVFTIKTVIIVIILLFVFYFFNDIFIKIISLVAVFLLILFYKSTGTGRLRVVYYDKENELLEVKQGGENRVVPLSIITRINRTYLSNQFTYRIVYEYNGKINKLYFLPKSKLFSDFLPENTIIQELKDRIREIKNG